MLQQIPHRPSQEHSGQAARGLHDQDRDDNERQPAALPDNGPWDARYVKAAARRCSGNSRPFTLVDTANVEEGESRRFRPARFCSPSYPSRKETFAHETHSTGNVRIQSAIAQPLALRCACCSVRSFRSVRVSGARRCARSGRGARAGSGGLEDAAGPHGIHCDASTGLGRARR